MAIENVIATTDNCRYCLMCRHVCPIGHVTRLETLTPHGWGLTIASVRRGLLEWNAETVDVLYSCADCGTCRAHCVFDQPLPEAIAAARAEVADQGLAPRAAYDVNDKLVQFGTPYAETALEVISGTGPDALFVGDEAAYLWPPALEAALKLLKAAGVEPVQVGVGRNSGYTASSLGFVDTAKTLVTATLDEIKASGATRVFVLAPGDYFTFSQLADERLGIDWPEGVELVEVIPFLAEKLAAGEISFKQGAAGAPYAYVDPTHTVRVTERVDAPRALLNAVMPAPGIELFWRRDRTHPVGSGALKFTQPHLANHLTWARMGDAAERGARLLICEDPASLHALSEHTERFGMQVQGLYELLADHLV